MKTFLPKFRFTILPAKYWRCKWDHPNIRTTTIKERFGPVSIFALSIQIFHCDSIGLKFHIFTLVSVILYVGYAYMIHFFYSSLLWLEH